MVRHTVDGWVCSDTTAAAIAEGLQYFLADPERARLAGTEARASELAYNRGRFAAEWAEVFSVSTDLVTPTVHTQPS
jgi:glycosyltransferase involved in cell wall biosynthesis